MSIAVRRACCCSCSCLSECWCSWPARVCCCWEWLCWRGPCPCWDSTCSFVDTLWHEAASQSLILRWFLTAMTTGSPSGKLSKIIQVLNQNWVAMNVREPGCIPCSSWPARWTLESRLWCGRSDLDVWLQSQASLMSCWWARGQRVRWCRPVVYSNAGRRRARLDWPRSVWGWAAASAALVLWPNSRLSWLKWVTRRHYYLLDCRLMCRLE